MDVRTAGDRRFFTVLEHAFASPQDWAGRRDLFLYFRGEGSGRFYRFLIYTDPSYQSAISFTWQDVQPGWRVMTFGFPKPTGALGRPDLTHVMALRVATTDTLPASFAVGSLSISQPGSP